MATTAKQYNQSAAKKLMTYSDLAQTKSFTIESPTLNQQVTLGYFPPQSGPGQLHIETAEVVLLGSSTPSVSFQIRSDPSRSATGKLIGSGTATSTTTPDVFDIDTATADWSWIKFTAVSGTVDAVTINLTFRGGAGDTRAVPVPPPPPPPAFNTISWTTVPTAAVGEREIHVAVGGSDTGSYGDDMGGGEIMGDSNNPFATPGYGKGFMRSGHGDRLMLNKGDTWDESLGTWTLSGESAARPMVVMSYGTGARPILRTGSSNGISTSGAISHFWLKGIEFYGHTFNGADTTYGIAFNPAVHNNVLIENCCAHSYRYGIYLSGQQVGSVYTWVGMATNFTVRGNTVYDCHRDVFGYTSQAGVSAGMYTYNINGLLVEFNCFQRNGFNNPTYINYLRRNIYHDNVNLNAIYRSNLLFGTDGIQLRAGGELTGNVISQACSAITLGAGSIPVQTTGVVVTCEDNVILEGQDRLAAAQIRNSGITVSNVTGGTIKRNIVASGGCVDATLTPCAWWFSNTASYLHNCRNTVIQDNIAHNWGGYGLYFDGPLGNYAANTFSNNVIQNPDNTVFYEGGGEDGQVVQASAAFTGGVGAQFAFSDNHYNKAAGAGVDVRQNSVNISFATWFSQTGDSGSLDAEVTYDDPDRTIGTYNVTLGGADDHTEFEDACVAMDEDTWDDDYTAPAVVAYIKEGFTEV